MSYFVEVNFTFFFGSFLLSRENLLTHDLNIFLPFLLKFSSFSFYKCLWSTLR